MTDHEAPGPDPGPEAPRPGGDPDPFGKRALFWRTAPIGTTAAAPGAVLGRRAMFSEPVQQATEVVPTLERPVAGRGSITVRCSSCRAVSRVGLLDFLLYQLPIGIWLPRGTFDRWMTCPTCRRRVWASVTLRRA